MVASGVESASLRSSSLCNGASQILQECAGLAHIDLMGLVAPGFVERLRIPAAHGWQFEERRRVVHRSRTELEAIGLDPECDRAEKCIDRRECRPSQEGSAELAKSPDPKLFNSIEVALEFLRDTGKLDPNTTIHRANFS